MTADRTTMLKRAAGMRQEPTEPERRLWRALSRSQLGGYKFRRQATIGNRIVDFYCPAKALAVEVDGHTHDAVHDAACDRQMMDDCGVTVLRFGNVDVMTNIEGVLQVLINSLETLPDRWRTNRDPASGVEGR